MGCFANEMHLHSSKYLEQQFSFFYCKTLMISYSETWYDDVNKWKHFPRYWPFVRGIHRSPVNCPHKDQWCGALVFSLICAWLNDWENNREAGDLRRRRAHYDVTVLSRDVWKHVTFSGSHREKWALLHNVTVHNDVVHTLQKITFCHFCFSICPCVELFKTNRYANTGEINLLRHSWYLHKD